MRLFSTKKKETIAPIWEFTARGIIWRLLLSENGFFVGEERNLESKTVSFFCLDQRSGSPLWNDRTFPEHWWISLEATHKNIVFIHEFVSPDMPRRWIDDGLVRVVDFR